MTTSSSAASVAASTVSAVSTTVQNRIMATLFVAQSFYSASTTASFILLPIIAAQLSGSDWAAGVPSTIILLGRAAIGYPIGWFMDRAGRRAGLSVGYLFAAIGALIAVLAIGWSSFIGFCIGAVFSGMGRGVTELARFAAAEVYSAARRARAISWVVWAGTVGAIGGPLLVDRSSKLAEQYGYLADAGPFLLSIGLSVVALALTFLFLRPDPMQIGQQMARADGTGDTMLSTHTLSEILRRGPVRLAIFAMVIGQLTMTLMMVITPLHMKHHDHAVGTISIVIMLHAVGMFGLSGVTGWLTDRYGQITMIVLGGVVLTIAAVLSPVSTAVSMLATSMFLLGLGWNFCFIAGSSLLASALLPGERGRIQGASDGLVALAAGVGSLATGPAFDQGGMLAVSVIGLVMSLLLMMGTVWSIRRFGQVWGLAG